jgi:very-short-patch-repair endonuclease
VRTTNRIDDPESKARAYAVRMPKEQVFSHATAAIILGMRVPRRLENEPLHVTSASEWATRMKGVVGHRTEAGLPYLELRGLRVTTPADTWAALSSKLTLDELIVAGDGLVRRRGPLASLGELRSAVAIRTGARGVKKLRRAFLDVRENTDSARETHLRLLICRSGLPEPEINVAIVNRYGAVIAHGDLVYRAAKVVIEYDGDHHFEDADQYRIDIARLDEVMEEGYRVIRVDKYLLAAPATLIGKIRDALFASGEFPRL